jgi:hypothetical protein
MQRRHFLKLMVGSAALGLAACSERDDAHPDAAAPSSMDAMGPDAAPASDALAADPCEGVARVDVYDTYAQALYLDETYGPLTGIIYASDVESNQSITLDFWHGHGGQLHQFTLGSEEFSKLKKGERVYVTTTEVDSHMHTLFVDPLDPDYRVPGAEPISLPVEDC